MIINTGVGFGAYINYMDSDDFSTLYSSYNGSKTHPHSAIILLYAECGIISVIFFFMFLFIIPISLFIKLFKTLKFKDSNNYIIYLCTFAISMGFIVVNIISETAIYDAKIFPLFVIILFITYPRRSKYLCHIFTSFLLFFFTFFYSWLNNTIMSTSNLFN